jgi:hypothetical protein
VEEDTHREGQQGETEKANDQYGVLDVVVDKAEPTHTDESREAEGQAPLGDGKRFEAAAERDADSDNHRAG